MITNLVGPKDSTDDFEPPEEDGHDAYLDQIDIEELHGIDTDEDYVRCYDD